MKIFGYFLALILTVLVLVFGLQYVASERVEVVQLHAPDDSGEMVTTRLWIVDDEGYPYLRSTDINAGWAARALAAPIFELTRNGNRQHYRAQPRTDKRDRINSLMRTKYTWGDRVIELMVGGRQSSVPMQLLLQN